MANRSNLPTHIRPQIFGFSTPRSVNFVPGFENLDPLLDFRFSTSGSVNFVPGLKIWDRENLGLFHVLHMENWILRWAEQKGVKYRMGLNFAYRGGIDSRLSVTWTQKISGQQKTLILSFVDRRRNRCHT